VNRTARNRIKG